MRTKLAEMTIDTLAAGALLAVIFVLMATG